MKGYIIILGLLMFSCSAIKINYTDTDSSLLFQNDNKGKIWLSSLNSAHQINIIKHEEKGDTLYITYERGTFTKPNNIVPLNDNIKYLRCANKLYKVETKEDQYNLIELK